jgi:hypothetical protein
MSHRAASGPAEPHLAEHELVDALEGTLDPRRLAHVSSCPDCAAHVDELRAIASDAAILDVPEPPAFFWSQLSARVRASIAEEPQPGPWSLAWRRWGRPAFAIAAVAIIAGTLATLGGFRSRNSGTSVPPAVALQSLDDADDFEDVFAEIDNDEAWALVRTLAEDLDHDDLEGQGVSARPGAADHLTLELSASERIELVRLLEEQLKGRTLPGSAS